MPEIHTCTMCIRAFHKSVHAFVDGVRSVVMTCSLPFCRLTAGCMRFLRYSELSLVALLSCPAFTCGREKYYQPRTQTCSSKYRDTIFPAHLIVIY